MDQVARATSSHGRARSALQTGRQHRGGGIRTGADDRLALGRLRGGLALGWAWPLRLRGKGWREGCRGSEAGTSGRGVGSPPPRGCWGRGARLRGAPRRVFPPRGLGLGRADGCGRKRKEAGSQDAPRGRWAASSPPPRLPVGPGRARGGSGSAEGRGKAGCPQGEERGDQTGNDGSSEAPRGGAGRTRADADSNTTSDLAGEPTGERLDSLRCDDAFWRVPLRRSWSASSSACGRARPRGKVSGGGAGAGDRLRTAVKDKGRDRPGGGAASGRPEGDRRGGHLVRRADGRGGRSQGPSAHRHLQKRGSLSGGASRPRRNLRMPRLQLTM